MSDFKAKCTKFDFDWGSAPDPTGGAYSASPDPLAWFERAYFYGQGGGRKRRGREGREREGNGGEGKGLPPFWNPKYATVVYCTKNDLRGEIVQNPNFAPHGLLPIICVVVADPQDDFSVYFVCNNIPWWQYLLLTYSESSYLRAISEAVFGITGIDAYTLTFLRFCRNMHTDRDRKCPTHHPSYM